MALHLPEKMSVVTWTAMINMYPIPANRSLICYLLIYDRYEKTSRPQEALSLFEQMKATGIHPNEFTFACVLTAIAETTNLVLGQTVHSQIKVYTGFIIPPF